jgi:hypothetical protein
LRRFFSSADNWGPILFAAILIIGAWSIAHHEISTLSNRADADARIRVTQLATSYRSDVASTFRLVDTTLRFVGNYYLENGMSRTEEMIRRDRLYSGVLGNIGIVDAHGNGMAFGPGQSGRIAVGDRAYVRGALRTQGMVIGAPIVGRMNKRLAIPFARAIRRPDGSLAGVVTAVIAVDGFAYGFDTGDYGPKGLITIVGVNDHVAFVRFSGERSTEHLGGTILASSPLWRLLAAHPN